MWIVGARGDNLRETGIIEEIELENVYRNPSKIYSIWDSILYEKVRFQANLTPLLTAPAWMRRWTVTGSSSVTGWQSTTQLFTG